MSNRACCLSDERAANAIADIKRQINIPLVVDIHFDYKLALKAIEGGADKIRINPGNIGKREKVEAVVKAAKEKGIPIRIGVNAGSLEKESLRNMDILQQMAWLKVHCIISKFWKTLISMTSSFQ